MLHPRGIVPLFVCLLLLGRFATRVAAADTIYACAHKTSGAVRVIKPPAACVKNEVPLSWDVQGPQGPQGDPGTPGEQGLQGLPGLSGEGPAYAVVRSPSTPADMDIPSTETELIRLDLPAGSYAIFGSVWVGSKTGEPIGAICNVKVDTDGDVAVTDTSTHATLALSFLHTFAADGSVTLNCFAAQNAAPAQWMLAKVTAIQVRSTMTTRIQ